MSKQIEKIEKELPTVSFTTNKDSKKYRDKKRKERQIKKEKGIKVNKIKKQVYNSDSEDEKDSDEDEIEDEFASLSEEEEEEKEKIVENNKKQKTSSSSSSNEPVNRFELDKEALSNKLSSILAHGTSTKKQKPTTTTAAAAADGSTILSKSEQTLNETLKKEKEKKKQEKERQLEKELLQTKDYKPIEILLTPEERDLMRLAKKGVIKLFNAVTQHQQSGLTASVDQKSKNITKNQFLENLKNTKVKKANEDDDDYSDDDYSDDQKDGEQWDVLKDDYLVKNEYDIKEEQD
ncbi:hypothetical protein DDB_G0271724 [Dictyostelium discoideum AX4]|uniref:RRP15-like protein n=1 Tax=Dictyostelium discoideum TaxID=44689 RepID=Q75JE2_DICDI|nr:hypothetical protein DDB_G0271724 [Dictyostelium discoideum AX4]EAL71552.1 hypothetical protein DDB_G0271724 [Dictyostelium discoideum AX4]|eukprot:XP_645514.1 hypothetical protein DDB_G0271724 [Dictyostelium discoideum AX4]